MQPSRGRISIHRLFSVQELGLGNAEPYVDRIINRFLIIGEGIAARWIQMPRAILLLQMVPNDPASGAIYFYDRVRQDFYMLSFEGEDDNLTVEDFCQLLHEYNLLRYAEEPNLLQVSFPELGAA